MTDLKVGDQCEITQDFPRDGWIAKTVVTLEGKDVSTAFGRRFKVRSDTGQTGVIHTDYLKLVSPTTPTPPSARKFLACPHCGADDSFYEVNRSINSSNILFVDADTGEIEWWGETEYGDPYETMHYECGSCSSLIDEWYFDPAKRAAHDEDAIRAARESLDAILSS